MKELLRLSVFCLFLIFGNNGFSQNDTIQPEEEELVFQYGMFPKEEPTELRQIGVNGFYRFFGTYTQHHEDMLLDQNAGVYANDRVVFIGDDSQLPNLWINLSGKPGPKSSLNFDIFTFQFLDGQLGTSYSGPVSDSLTAPNIETTPGNGLGATLLLNLGMNMSGNFDTDLGSFRISLGGTNWYHLSDLTFSSFRGFNRFGLFERNPWDPVQKNLTDKYNTFFEEGAIEQDTRWGNNSFQGLIIDGTSLPGGLTTSFLFGKTQLDGGPSTIPNSSVGGRLRKDFKSGQFVSLNTFNNRKYSDSLNTQSIGFNIHTIEFVKNLDKIQMIGEFGMGRYYAPDYISEWGEALNLKFRWKNKKFPLELHMYRISPKVINNNALFWNSAIQEYTTEEATVNPIANQNLFPNASSMVSIGQMTNNRQGVNINGEARIKSLTLNLGMGFASELEGISNILTYSHPVNGLTRSRIWRWNFPENVGPYNRYNVIYRGVYDSVELTDSQFGNDIKKKHFANIEILAKHKSKLFARDLFLMFLGNYSSAQDAFSPILVTTEDAYLRLYSSEIEAYYFLNEKINISGYLGYERSIANYKTNVDSETRRPRNQTGFGIGAGIEFSIGKNALMVLKHRNFEFKDASFALDRFKGSETLCEIKVFF